MKKEKAVGSLYPNELRQYGSPRRLLTRFVTILTASGLDLYHHSVFCRQDGQLLAARQHLLAHVGQKELLAT